MAKTKKDFQDTAALAFDCVNKIYTWAQRLKDAVRTEFTSGLIGDLCTGTYWPGKRRDEMFYKIDRWVCWFVGETKKPHTVKFTRDKGIDVGFFLIRLDNRTNKRDVFKICWGVFGDVRQGARSGYKTPQRLKFLVDKFAYETDVLTNLPEGKSDPKGVELDAEYLTASIRHVHVVDFFEYADEDKIPELVEKVKTDFVKWFPGLKY